METPQEKAVELFQKFYNAYGDYSIPSIAVSKSKELTLICVDEILQHDAITPREPQYYETIQDMVDACTEYWNEVKQELNKL